LRDAAAVTHFNHVFYRICPLFALSRACSRAFIPNQSFERHMVTPFSFDDDTREDFANASEHAALLAEAGVLQKLVALLHGDVASAEAAATIAKLLVRNEYCKKVLHFHLAS